MVTTDPDTGPLNRSDLVKGYEISKGEYVLITKDDLDSVKLETTRTLDIESFVDADTIDRVYWENPYFLVPDGKEALDAYAVIHEAMKQTNRMALGRLVMHTRERLMAIEPRGKGLMAYTLRMANEVKAADDAFAGIPQGKPSKQMIEIAWKLIEQKEADFTPDEFVDRYEMALKDLIEEKRKGHKPARSAEPSDTNVIDLMAALTKSLSHGGARSVALKKPAAKTKRARA
jgi:DNA end-binding protein Ku